MTGFIQGIVALVSDEHDPGSRRNMAVVRHIDQQVIESVLLDPAMIDRDQSEQVEPVGVRSEELDTELVEIHGFQLTASAASAIWGAALAFALAFACCSLIRW